MRRLYRRSRGQQAYTYAKKGDYGGFHYGFVIDAGNGNPIIIENEIYRRTNEFLNKNRGYLSPDWGVHRRVGSHGEYWGLNWGEIDQLLSDHPTLLRDVKKNLDINLDLATIDSNT